MREELLIIGAGGHGKSVADVACCTGKYKKIFFLDDDENIMETTYPVVGKIENIWLYKNTHDVFVAIGNPKLREKLLKDLIYQNMSIPVIIHPQAVIGGNTLIGVGTVVMPGAVIGPNSSIGQGCIINTCASVDHDNLLEDYVHISVGAHLAGTVRIGHGTMIGIGAVVSNNLKVCEGCMIGAGAVVTRNITQPGIYIGVPAKRKS